MKIKSRIDSEEQWVCCEEVADIHEQPQHFIEKVVQVEGASIQKLVSTQIISNGLCILDTHMVFNRSVRDFFEVEGDHIMLGFMFSGKAIADIEALERQKEYPSNFHKIRYSPSLKAVFEMPSLVEMNYFLIIMSKAYYFRVIHKDSSLHTDFAQQILDGQNSYLYHDALPITPEMNRLISDIRSSRKSGDLKRMFIEAKVIELLMLQLEQLHSFHSNDTPSILRGEDRSKVEQAKCILESSFKEPPGLQELARMIYLNEFKLKQGFKELYGITVYGYVIRLRMEKAQQLLLEGRLSIGEIAWEVGYKNSAHFTAAYKKYFGLVPSEHKRKQTWSG